MMTGSMLAAAIGIAIGALLLVLAIYWLIFPWVICVRLKSIDETLKRIEEKKGTV